MKRGISLLDLLPLPPGTQMLVPAAIAGAFENLAVLDHRSLSTDAFHIHYGTLRAISNMGLPALNNWPVEAPLLNRGVRFQMVRRRVPPPAGALPAGYVEPASTSFHVDLFLDRVAITIPGLKPAQLVPAAADKAAHLVADPSRTKVRIIGGGTMRLAFSGGSLAPSVFFVSRTDDIDPLAPTGPVFELAFDPPHFFFGSSEFGATVQRLMYDGSPDFTPAEIEQRGMSAAWCGIAIQEGTVYMPRNARWIGDLNAGVRDLLIGSPMGLMGEIFVEFGRSPVDPTTLKFRQLIEDAEIDLGGIEPEPGTTRAGRLMASPDGYVARIRGVTASPLPGDYTLLWTLPDGSTALGAESPYFDVHNGDTIKVAPIEVSEGKTLAISPTSEIIVEFLDKFMYDKPAINLTFPGVKFMNADLHVLNVTSVSGRADQLNGIRFETDQAGNGLRWSLGRAIGMPRGTDNVFVPTFPDVPGIHDLVITDAKERRRRAQVEIVAHGSTLIGCADGVYRIVGNIANRAAVEAFDGVHDQDRFHATGYLTPGVDEARVNDQGEIEVPGGALATAVVITPADDSSTEVALPIPPGDPIRHVQVLMDFGDVRPLGWGDAGLAESFGIAALRAWAYQMTAAGAEIIIVGRASDVEPNREQLGIQRAAAAFDWLTGPDQPGDEYPNPEIVYPRGETQPPTQDESSIQPPPGVGNLCTQENAAELGTSFPDLPPRPLYQRVDIYAIGVIIGDVPLAPNIEAQIDPHNRRVLVPGNDVEILPICEPHDTAKPYRVQLRVRWDSPTITTLADAVPTLAEVTVIWKKESQMPLPGTNETVTPEGPETYTVIGRWTYDARSGATQFSLSLDNEGSPDGLFKIKNNTAATAFALGPALMSGLDAMPTDSQAVHIAAMLGACGAAAALASNGEVTFYGVTIEDRQEKLTSLKDSRWRLLFDYTAKVGFSVNTSVLSLTATEPIQIKYKGAGLEIDDKKTGIDKFALVYDDCSFDVVNPGQWTIGGTLGKLLRVIGTRAGAGSTWMEIDLGFMIDLGPVRITNATIRVTFPIGGDPLNIELRGLGVEINIPGTLSGGGRLALTSEGLRAALELHIEPAQVYARGSLQLKNKMAAIELALLLPVGIPLGSSGLGLFGFLGRFVANGRRALPVSDDPVQREVDWYQKVLPEAKYTDEDADGQYALGLGAVIGSLPDQGFTFNAAGMLTVAFPDLEVVFGLDAKLLKKTGAPAEKGEEPAPQSLTLFGLLVFNEDAFILGIRGAFEVPKLLSLKIPLSGYFPRNSDSANAYLRIGADNYEGRLGDPVTITLFPGFLDFKAWAYLMIEQRSLHNLGGKEKLDLDGFSIGFGAGWEVSWSAGPIRLAASAYWMLGMGTAPLTLVGAIGVRGELSLVIISIAASADVQGRLQDTPNGMAYELDGDFKGKVDLLFFTVEGSVHFHVASGEMDDIPTPPHPLTRVDLTDRNGVITGRAPRADDAIDPNAPPTTVWPDTVPVLQFAHNVQNNLSDSPFNPSPPAAPGPVWSGTSDLKYAYRLNKIALVKKTPYGDEIVDGPLDSVWWWPTHRGGLLNPADPEPSEAEGRHLALMSWHPTPWMRNMEGGGKGTPGDPAKTVENICEPPKTPVRNVALGASHERLEIDEIAFKPAADGVPPYPTFFTVHGQETAGGMSYAAYTALAASKGLIVRQGKNRLFPAPVGLPGENATVAAGYEVSHTTSKYQFVKTLRFEGLLAPDLVQPSLLLAVWDTMDQVNPFSAVCDFFSALSPRVTLGSQLVRGTLTFSSVDNAPLQAVDWVAADGKAELWLGNNGVRVKFQSAQQWVRVTVASWGSTSPVVLTAYSASNGVIGMQNLSLAAGQVATLSILAPSAAIASIVVRGGGAKQAGSGITTGGCLLGLCWSNKVEDPSIASTWPQVTGKRPNKASAYVWNAAQVGTVAVPVGSCRIVRYTPPPGDPNVWTSFTIPEFGAARVLVLSVSGVSWTAQQLADDNEDAKDGIKEDLGESDPQAPGNEKKALLAGNMDYELRVDMQWAGWSKAKQSKLPSAPDESTWQSFPQAVFSFKTATMQVDPEQPVDFKDETGFDPRAVVRYLIGFRPDGTGAPHFRDDPVKVDFCIGHLEQLLAIYGRELVLKVRRTDSPPRDPTKEAVKAGDVNMTVDVVPLDQQAMSPPDAYFNEVVEQAPCLPNPPKVGGQSLQATGALAPRAEYDVLLVATPAGQPQSDEVLLARTHFSSSRYRDHEDLVRALGFHVGEPNAILAQDLLLTESESLPADEITGSDAELEKTLVALGMAPWPPAKSARTVLLWKTGAPPTLDGVLIEADEPLVREGRFSIDVIRVFDAANSVAVSNFWCVRSNAAGTRLLFAGTPVTPQGGQTLQLRGTYANALPFIASRHVIEAPRVLLQEVI